MALAELGATDFLVEPEAAAYAATNIPRLRRHRAKGNISGLAIRARGGRGRTLCVLYLKRDLAAWREKYVVEIGKGSRPTVRSLSGRNSPFTSWG
jgi:hypothetical protein